jgi:hypothetical protein
LDAEVTKLDGAQVARPPVDQHRLHSS